MKHAFGSVLPHGASSLPTFCDNILAPGGEQLKATNFFALFSQPDRRGQSIEHYLERFTQDAN